MLKVEGEVVSRVLAEDALQVAALVETRLSVVPSVAGHTYASEGQIVVENLRARVVDHKCT